MSLCIDGSFDRGDETASHRRSRSVSTSGVQSWETHPVFLPAGSHRRLTSTAGCTGSSSCLTEESLDSSNRCHCSHVSPYNLTTAQNMTAKPIMSPAVKTCSTSLAQSLTHRIQTGFPPEFCHSESSTASKKVHPTLFRADPPASLKISAAPELVPLTRFHSVTVHTAL